jgi:hypothetical protein
MYILTHYNNHHFFLNFLKKDDIDIYVVDKVKI